ncbi:hypothetical protein SAMN04489723_13313 [Algoriphagus aquimarinus]|uniref:Uncharacterized protein n=1 Tax=Algoriphagus aquimarinus TaxID=237018 RepID=A0A1I1CF64_9BACT|nr:hypothetical protein SAMN04489723_13313 [Algoriphagus aquimarinus]
MCLCGPKKILKVLSKKMGRKELNPYDPNFIYPTSDIRHPTSDIYFSIGCAFSKSAG